MFILALLKTQRELKKSYSNTLYALVLSLEARDSYSAGHSMRVAALSKQLPQKIGLKRENIAVIHRAALLHDIGKIGIQDSILLKNGQLDMQEMEKIKEHPLIASALLRTVQKYYEKEIRIIEAHHERWDGRGYPRGLQQKTIPLGASIIAIADAFDAMTSDRPYRKAHSFEQALEEIIKNSDSQFDPFIVSRFESLVLEDRYTLDINEDISILGI